MTAPLSLCSVPELPGCGLVCWKLDGTILHANDRFWSILGREPSTSSNVGYWAITAPGQKQREMNLLLGGEGGFEKEFIHGNGLPVTVRLLGGRATEEGVFYAYVDPQIGSSEREGVDRALRHQNAILLELTKADALDSGDIAEALRLVTEAGATGLRCARSSIWLYADGETKIHCHDLFEREKSAHTSGFDLTAKDFPGYFVALAEDRTIAANDAHTHPATREFSKVYLEPLGITSMLEAPIRSHGKLVGVLCSEHIGPMRKFSQEEQNFAANVADAFGRALQASARRRYEMALKDANNQLESTVRARTASLQTALDSMGDGLLVCERSGFATGERSRAVEEWFGPIPEGVKVWDYLCGDEEPLRSNLSCAYGAVFDGFMPFEVSRDQAPSRFERNGRVYSLSYRIIGPEDAVEKLVILIRDITADVAAARSEALARELAAVVGHLVRDRNGFVSFVEDSNSLLQRLASPALPMIVRLRALHTLKGNTAIYGFASVASICHELESEVRAEPQDGLTPELVAKLDAGWRSAMAPVAALLANEDTSAVRVLDREHREFIRLLESRADHADLVQLARSWKHELVSSLFAPFVAQGRRMAESLGKKVAVHIDDHGERLPDAQFRPFFSELIHCVRNALDHGIELPEVRAAAGKAEEGRLELDARRVGPDLVVTISDDGQGIDWDLIRKKAALAGLPSTSEQDLTAALLSDGFTTREDASEISGRGVGMSAVGEACRALGGRFHIETKRGVGTRLVFILPSSRRSTAPRPSRRPALSSHPLV